MSSVVRCTTVAELLRESRSTISLAAPGTTRTVDITTAELVDAGTRLANALRDAGTNVGDRIGLQMDNTRAYLDALAACAIGGFVAMSVNRRFSDELSASLVARSGASRLWSDASDLIRGSSEAAAPGPTPVPAPVSSDDRYVIFTTSGTTSAPKLVVHTQRSIAHHAGDVAPYFGYDRAAVVLVALPLCGTFGLATLMAALAGHSHVVLPETFEATQCVRLVEKFGVTSVHGSDDMFHRMLEVDGDLSSVVTAGYGRFNSSLDGIVERAAQRGVELRGIYGMSEVQALYAFRGDDTPPSARAVAGGRLVSPGAACRVVDGELQLKGPSLFAGYLADGGSEIDEQLTSAHFADGWFRTGDLAEMPAGADADDRTFAFLTRLGDVLRLGGFLVAPAEIESAVMAMPNIAACQVVAVDRPSGARPVAFVILTDPTETVAEEQIIAHCQQTLARFKSPVRVIAVPEFPVTDGPNGVKIQRARLRSMAEELLSP